jgi:fido (protein-threonine AMPylation protein)
MSKKVVLDLPEVFLSHGEIKSAVARATKAGLARKIGPRLYTNNMVDQSEEIIRRNLWQVVGLLLPGSVVGHRTALEGRPSSDGTVFLTGSYSRTVSLPGLTIRQVTGPGALPGDQPFIQNLWIASRARAFLEVLKPTRASATGTRGLPVEEVEARIETIIRTGGEEEANKLRDRAGEIFKILGADEEIQTLDGIIGAILSTRKVALKSPVAIARAGGRPYDPHRFALFQEFHSALLKWTPVSREDPQEDDQEYRNLAFFDAYFSNFIEGTEFEIDEAFEIVFENRIPEQRPQDAHDILGTFRLVSNRAIMGESMVRIGKTTGGFLNALRDHHRVILGGRPEGSPGELKQRVNRAGNTVFVEPDLVTGTLKKGFEVFRSLPEPMTRAIFLMFLVSEVHPFDDGNGRLARVVMNAELTSANQRRIIIPTAYRDDYLLALRAMTRQSNPVPLIRMLDYAQEFTSRVDFRDLQGGLAVLRDANAFLTPTEGRLRMPQ